MKISPKKNAFLYYSESSGPVCYLLMVFHCNQLLRARAALINADFLEGKTYKSLFLWHLCHGLSLP